MTTIWRKPALLILVSALMLNLCSVTAFAQNDSLKHVEFRALLSRDGLASRSDINAILNGADSLFVIHSRKAELTWDSLQLDSTLLANGFAALMHFESFFIAKSKQDNASALRHLRAVQQDGRWPALESPVFVFLHQLCLDEFSAVQDFEAATFSHAQIGIWTSHAWGEKEEMLNDSITALREEMKLREAEWKTQSESDKQQYLLMLAGAGLLLLLMIALWIMQMARSRRLKNKIGEQEAVLQDKSELEALTRKINDLKTEALQFRNTAQATIDKLNSMDQDRRKTAAELRTLSEELGVALQDLRQQSESAKSSLPPAIYMALQNISTRLSASAQQRIQALREINK